MKKNIRNISYVLFLFIYPMFIKGEYGIITVPVADLVGSPIQSFGLAKTIDESYQRLALCGGCNKPSDAFRLHQALYNDLIEIVSIEQHKNGEREICFKYPSAFFITSSNHKPNNLFWTSGKNVLLLKDFEKHSLPLKYIPFPLSFTDFSLPHQVKSGTTIGLIKPFYNSENNTLFSVGTRFVIDPSKSTSQSYAAFMLDPRQMKFKTIFIPTDSALITDVHKSPHEAIQCFVYLLKLWTHFNGGIIAYVWGGSSFTGPFLDQGFSEEIITLPNGQQICTYNRKNYQQTPFCGFDCTGLILRAAQLAGIPYFYKNTHTLAHYLKSLGIGEHLHEGDLIWIPGHVMTISSLSKNLLIEARGYSHEFGFVQEISLEKVFKGIKNYSQLVHAFHTQQPLIRLNKAGKEVETIKRFKILKLESVWH